MRIPQFLINNRIGLTITLRKKLQNLKIGLRNYRIYLEENVEAHLQNQIYQLEGIISQLSQIVSVNVTAILTVAQAFSEHQKDTTQHISSC